MILSGNGREVTVPGKNLRISVTLDLERKDLSGQTSQCSFAGAGVKPQKVSVSLQLPVTDADKLTALAEAAKAVDKNNNPLVYAVGDNLCAAMNIREVIFNGPLRATESDGLQAYDVSFELNEYNSPAGKREQRTEASTAATAKDGTVPVGSTDPAKVAAAAKATSGAETK